MDLINKAKDWKQVDEQLTHEVLGHLTSETRKIPSNGMLTLKVMITYLAEERNMYLFPSQLGL